MLERTFRNTPPAQQRTRRRDGRRGTEGGTDLGGRNGSGKWRESMEAVWNKWRNMKYAVKYFLRERKDRDNGVRVQKSGTSRLMPFLSPVKYGTEE